MSKEFTRRILPSDDLIKFPEGDIMNFLLKDTFKLRTIVAGGALAQILLCAALPLKWAMVPALCICLNAFVTTLCQLWSPQTSSFLDGVVEDRSTAQLPTEKGNFGSEPATGSVVVFQLGIQYNHPLGVFGPGRKELAAAFMRMNKDLMLRREELGLISVSRWRGNERETNNTFMLTYFFKDVQSLNQFAHEEAHRQGWESYLASDYKRYIGIFHETYVVPRKSYESLYANCRPILFGRGQVACETEAGTKWVNTLVSARDPRLKTHFLRLGRDREGNVPFDEEEK
jgi:heme-degrading monooxygenase HmoA